MIRTRFCLTVNATNSLLHRSPCPMPRSAAPNRSGARPLGRRDRREEPPLPPAPLHDEAADPPNDDIEETLAQGIALAHREPTVARTLPVCLYRQRDRLRAERLRRHALELGEKRALGFFLDLTSDLRATLDSEPEPSRSGIAGSSRR